MLHNAYLLAKIGADTDENERNVAEISLKLATTLRPLLLARLSHDGKRTRCVGQVAHDRKQRQARGGG